jgi:hypothetical protein
MQARKVAVLIAGVAVLVPAVSGCGSNSKQSIQPAVETSPAAQSSLLGGPAPASLVGTFTTTINRKDAAAAPKPDEMPIGSWTLVIDNSGGPNHFRALGIGDADNARVVYGFGVKGNLLSMGCVDDQGLPASGSESYTWSVEGTTLSLKPSSAPCKQGDPNHPVILTSHPWTKQTHTSMSG